jgi:hypothetical protein
VLKPAAETAQISPVGTAEGCDLLIFILKIKRSQPAAAPTGYSSGYLVPV